MKFCYVDESGCGEEPIFVIVGVIVDSQRMHVTKQIWGEVLEMLSDVCGREITEFHMNDFYNGRGSWYNVSGQERSKIITAILRWVQKRKHKVTFSAILKTSYIELVEREDRLKRFDGYWCAGAMHLMLGVQKCHQKESKAKGHTVFVFDEQYRHQKRLTELVTNPPSWTDDFYSRGKKQQVLDQIVDVPYFADSEPVLMIQIADLIAYLLRRFAELSLGLDKARYDDELDKIKGWVGLVEALLISSSHRWPKKSRTSSQELFHSLAPEPLRNLG